MKLIIHAGAGKTGSSAIQSSLNSNVELLASKGVLYTGLYFENLEGYGLKGKPAPVFFDEHLSNDSSNFLDFCQKSILNAVTKCKSDGLDTIIWSNEGIFSAPNKIGPLINKISVYFDEITFLVYLRRQDHWFSSAYQQWGIKHKTYEGPVKPFSAWFEGFSSQGGYFSILKEWEQYFSIDNMNVNIYELTSDVVFDFMQKLGVQYEKNNTKKKNSSINNIQASFYKLYNSLFKGKKLPHDIHGFLSRTGIDKLNFNSVCADLDYPSEAELRDILKIYSDDNKKLSRYDRDGYSVCFPDGGEVLEKSGKVDRDDLISSLLFAVVKTEARVKKLEQELDEIRSIIGSLKVER